MRIIEFTKLYFSDLIDFYVYLNYERSPWRDITNHLIGIFIGLFGLLMMLVLNLCGPMISLVSSIRDWRAIKQYERAKESSK